MSEITIKIFEKLSPELEKQTDELRYIAFNKKDLTPKQKEINNEKFTFSKDCFAYIIAFIQNTPVGYIRLFKRTIHFYGKVVILGGIGGVCTDPHQQRKGIATQMLQIAIKELKKQHCDIAYLCTNIEKLGKLYGKVGFVPLNRQYTFTGNSGRKYFDTDGMIAPINSENIFQEVLNNKEIFDLEGLNW